MILYKLDYLLDEFGDPLLRQGACRDHKDILLLKIGGQPFRQLLRKSFVHLVELIGDDEVRTFLKLRVILLHLLAHDRKILDYCIIIAAFET